MTLIHLKGENGAEIYFDRDQLPAGVEKRIARGDLTEIAAGTPAGPQQAGEAGAEQPDPAPRRTRKPRTVHAETPETA